MHLVAPVCLFGCLSELSCFKQKWPLPVLDICLCLQIWGPLRIISRMRSIGFQFLNRLQYFFFLYEAGKAVWSCFQHISQPTSVSHIMPLNCKCPSPFLSFGVIWHIWSNVIFFLNSHIQLITSRAQVNRLMKWKETPNKEMHQHWTREDVCMQIWSCA